MKLQNFPQVRTQISRPLKGLSPQQEKPAAEMLSKFERLESYLDSSRINFEALTGQSGNSVSVLNGRLNRSGMKAALNVAKSAVSFLSLGLYRNEDRLESGVLSGTGSFGNDGELNYLHISCDEHGENYGRREEGWKELYSLHTSKDGTRTYSILGDQNEMLTLAPDGTAKYLV